jgi:hypothetical protein
MKYARGGLYIKKLMIGEKEITVDENTILQLSDDELEHACGGSDTGGWNCFRLVCDQCNFKSWWNYRKAEQSYLVDFHKQLCSGLLRDEYRFFESEPDPTAD